MSTPAGDAKRARREDARAKAAKLQAEAEAAERRRKGLLAALAALVVAAIAAGIFFVVQQSKKDDVPAQDAAFGTQGAVPLPAPAGSKPAAANAVTIRTGFDYMCPICKQFEDQTDAWQQQQVKAGAVKRELLPVAILDRFSQGAKYSTRSANAAYAVASADPAKLHDFTKEMFADQPAENSTGLTDDQIVAIAKKVVPNNTKMDNAIKSGSYTAYVAKITDQANKDGLSGTPTIWVNGKIVKFTNDGGGFLEQLQKAVNEAKGGTVKK